MTTIKERRPLADGASVMRDVERTWRWIVQNVYELPAQRGRRKGYALDDWLAAEDIVLEESQEAGARGLTRGDDVTHAPYRARSMVASVSEITSELTIGLGKWSER